MEAYLTRRLSKYNLNSENESEEENEQINKILIVDDQIYNILSM